MSEVLTTKTIETREILSALSKDQLIEMVIEMLDNEEKMRAELDKLTGVVR